MNDSYVTLIIDIKRSQAMNDKDRSICQTKLLDIINYMNEVYMEYLKEKLVFSAGDSIQGLFTDCSNAYNCYLFIKYLLYPYEIRCGIGYGTINKYISDNNIHNLGSNFIDGISYHNAKKAIDNAKKNDCDILIKSNNKFFDIILNQLLWNADSIEKGLSKKQFDIFDAYNIISPINFTKNNLISNDYVETAISYLLKNISNYKPVIDNPLYFELRSRIEKSVQKHQMIDELVDESGLILKGNMFDRDLSFYLGKILNVSRENIRQISNSGKFNDIRKIQIAVFMLIARMNEVKIDDN